jgi:muramidase (phage lysozyme)
MFTSIQAKIIAVALIAASALGCATETVAEEEGEGEEAAEAQDALTGGVPGNATCSPSKAAGAVPAKQKALLDTIAWAEGTRGRGSDGYNVIVGYKYAADCTRHPNRLIRLSSTLSSTAAGRYQFLTRTWNSLGLATFSPDNQERGGLKLVNRRGVKPPADRAMTATELTNALSKLSYEWASLPPNRYGQGIRSPAQVRAEYCRNAGCSK